MTALPIPQTLHERAQEVLDATSGHTPGPWSWRGQGGDDEMPKGAYLRSDTPGTPRHVVMDFARQGLQGAQPRFRVKFGAHSIMRPAVEIGGSWKRLPDVRVLAAAPVLWSLLEEALTALAAAEARDEGAREVLRRIVVCYETGAIIATTPAGAGNLDGVRDALRDKS